MSEAPKLLCVSLNPAVDRRIVVSQLRVGAVNRALSADPTAGGKAAHVAYAAAALGAQVRWLAFLGGPEGENCRAGVAARGVDPVVVETTGRTRTTLELIDESTGMITEVLEPGPHIGPEERDRFLYCFGEELCELPIVVLSGSLPAGLESSFYSDLVHAATKEGCTVLLDTSGASLENALSARPSLIKPNREEAAGLVGHTVQDLRQAAAAARALCSRGPETVALSLGGEGAVVAHGREIWYATAPRVQPRSTVGSGDSFLAGWAVATAERRETTERLRLAVACGTANCLATQPGVLDAEMVRTLEAQTRVERL